MLASASVVFLLSIVGERSATAPITPVLDDGKRMFVHGAAGFRLPGGGQREVKSLLKVGGRLSYGDFIWDEKGVPAGEIWMRVDLNAQIVSVFRAGHEIATAPLLHGAQEKPTPTGKFAILEKREDHMSNLYDAPMPYMLRLTNDGVAIHGSDVRAGAATHGCVGVPKEFAAKLFDQVRTGDEVVIVGEKISA